MIKEILSIIINKLVNKGPDFKVIYTPNSFNHTIICPKCNSEHCIEQDNYWNIQYRCLDCGYNKTC